MSFSEKRETEYYWHVYEKHILLFSTRVQDQFFMGNWPDGIWKTGGIN